MVDAGYITADAAERAKQEPIAVVARSVDNEAPYFIDYVGGCARRVVSRRRVETRRARHLHHARPEPAALRAGSRQRRHCECRCDPVAPQARPERVAQAALVALDPRSGEILAFIGGRSYNQSQFNRAATARRQVGSTFKPFVYLAAFEKAADEGSGDITPATLVHDEPTTWNFDNQEWTPRNYDGEYDGAITLRRALAMSRNVAAVKVAEQTGYERVVSLWKKAKVGGRGGSLSLRRAGRRRADATRSRRGLHGVSESRHAEEAALDRQHHERRGRGEAEDRSRTEASRGRRPRFWSRT